MRKVFAVLLLLIIGESAYAEYVTILPVNPQAMAGASSEIVTLSELYGKTTTIRYMTDDKSPAGIALNNTNIYPTDPLTLTEDVVMENQLFGFYVGAARQISESSASDAESQTVSVLRTISFTESEANYQAVLDRAKAEAGSNIALAKIIEEQINRASDSELLSLDTDLETDNTLLADDKTSSLIDSLLPGSSSNDGYDLPGTGDNIIISGIGGAILTGGSSGGGSGVGGGGGYTFADGGASVPEPSTWALLVLSVMGLAFYRKRSAR
ncbi:MAG: PEP-CTERM sorting domain-containing protein [Thermoguttaceae bacterium]|nr:PEP-CTERM sorting domain-containing protein [Thermoguttaceae bacterium]